MNAQLDLFAAPPPQGMVYPTSPHWNTPKAPNAVALMWHGLHLHRTAWYCYDARDQVWRCLDPFDQYGINDQQHTPPRVDQHGRLAL